MTRVYLSSIISNNGEDFDITEIQEILKELANVEPIDLAHAELLQQRALRGADICSELLGKTVKNVGVFESKINSTKNKVSLEYNAPDGSRTTVDMKKWAGESSKEVEEIQIKLAEEKGKKSVLEKKFDLLIRTHFHYKEIAAGLRRTVLGYTLTSKE